MTESLNHSNETVINVKTSGDSIEILDAKSHDDEVKFRLVSYIETLIILDRQRFELEQTKSGS